MTKTEAVSAFERVPRMGRRFAVAIAMLGFPLFVAAWLGLPALGAPPPVWAVVVGVLGLTVILVDYGLWSFRQSLAQAPEAALDERQVAIRDRAYLESYRILSGVLLLGVLVVGILPDLLDRSLQVTFETIQPVMWGLIHYTIILPSAVVAWREPDLESDDVRLPA